MVRANPRSNEAVHSALFLKIIFHLLPHSKVFLAFFFPIYSLNFLLCSLPKCLDLKTVLY